MPSIQNAPSKTIKARYKYADGRAVLKSSEKPVGFIATNGYRVVKILIDGIRYTTLEHRLIWFLLKGWWPSEIDHIDADKLNNRIENLRESNRRDNLLNRPNRRVLSRGVSYVPKINARNPYMAQISVGNKNIYLGYFPTEKKAAKAYQKALKGI